jgi:hypothetical protein
MKRRSHFRDVLESQRRLTRKNRKLAAYALEVALAELDDSNVPSAHAGAGPGR